MLCISAQDEGMVLMGIIFGGANLNGASFILKTWN